MYLPADIASPQPNDDDAPFWEHCRSRRLAFQQCADCARLVHPPQSGCPGCRSRRRLWADAPQRAHVHAFTWVHTAAHPSVKPALPYNVVLVEFPDMPGVRLLSNVVDATPDSLRVGAAVALCWEEGHGGQPLPRFRLQHQDQAAVPA